jgi:uncharacterized membrane protein YphA (DoxX/SURF4 family)
MSMLWQRLEPIDEHVTRWMARHGILLLRISLGLVFAWFGALKFFPGLSPAQDLAGSTIEVLSGGLVPAALAVPFLAAWEVAIGIGLLSGRLMRVTLALLWLQMLGTVTPLALFPDLCFTWFPVAPTLEGQYIIKNVVLVAAGLVLGATVRGGRLVADPTRRPPV